MSVDATEAAWISWFTVVTPQYRNRVAKCAAVQLSATRNSMATDKAILTRFVIRKVSVK